MTAIKEYKMQMLRENYRLHSDKSQTFSEVVNLTAQSDPNFFRWLFEDESLNDFECKYAESFSEFLELCKTYEAYDAEEFQS